MGHTGENADAGTPGAEGTAASAYVVRAWEANTGVVTLAAYRDGMDGGPAWVMSYLDEPPISQAARDFLAIAEGEVDPVEDGWDNEVEYYHDGWEEYEDALIASSEWCDGALESCLDRDASNGWGAEKFAKAFTREIGKVSLADEVRKAYAAAECLAAKMGNHGDNGNHGWAEEAMHGVDRMGRER